jgi:hypothetical protein
MTETITFAEVVAYNHKVMSRGSFFEQLRELAVARSSSLSRQLLEGVVEELENVGLISAAADLMEFAQPFPIAGIYQTTTPTKFNTKKEWLEKEQTGRQSIRLS